MTDIAETEGIGRTLASREANSPECRQFIAEFVGDEREEMRALFYRSMRVVEHALSAKREYLTKDGQILQGGPDHYARLAATKHFRDFLMASRPAPKQPEAKKNAARAEPPSSPTRVRRPSMVTQPFVSGSAEMVSHTSSDERQSCSKFLVCSGSPKATVAKDPRGNPPAREP